MGRRVEINLLENFQSLSFTRFLLLMLIVSFMLLVFTGILGPSTWDWKRFTFIALSLGSLYIAVVASEHYMHSHVWDHIIKKHLFRVFLWSLGALLLVHWVLSFWNLEIFIREHMVWVLLVGALIGIIPESGPHLILVMLYAEGLIPFSVLFTSSFVQDGHGIRNGFPLWSLSDYRNYKKEIFIPEETPFHQIWLLCDENSIKPHGIMRIM